MDNGFIVLHRKFLDWEWFKVPNMPTVWNYMLLKANWKSGRFRGHAVPRGSFVGSIASVAKGCGLSIQCARTCIKRLKSTGELTSQATHDFSIYTIVKYEEFQNVGSQPTNNLTSQLTGKQQATNKPPTTIEQGNKGTKKQEEPPNPQRGNESFDRFWEIYPKKVGKQAALKSWKRAKINGKIEEVLRAVETQKESDQWKKEHGQFIPNPATWINQGRWEDELSRAEKWREDFLNAKD